MASIDDATVSQPVTSRKPYVRIITDKRREQNRRAQKAYREKLKHRLEELEDQVASTSNHEYSTHPQIPPTDSGKGSASIPTHNSKSNSINLDDAFVAAGDVPIVDKVNFPTFHLNFGQSTIPTPGPSERSKLSPISNPFTSVQDDGYGNMEMLGIWPMPPRSPDQVYTPPKDSFSMTGGLNAMSATYAYDRQKRNFLGNMKPSSFNVFSHSPSRDHSSTSTLPDPYANNIRLVTEASMAATLAIGMTLGITRESYINDQPSRFPECFVMFYGSIPTPGNPRYDSFLKFKRHGSLEGTPAKLREHLAMIKPALRPSPVQLLEAHPTYLDCIVFPKFRERAIQASAEGKLDHCEFFLDLMHGGLVCWGSSMPNNNHTSRRRRRNMFDQVAWSSRSWEARRWFLKKWEWLIGTEEDEQERRDPDGIWANSRWWWTMRGEMDEDEYDSIDENDDDERRWAEGDVDPVAYGLGAAAYPGIVMEDM